MWTCNSKFPFSKRLTATASSKSRAVSPSDCDNRKGTEVAPLAAFAGRDDGLRILWLHPAPRLENDEAGGTYGSLFRRPRRNRPRSPGSRPRVRAGFWVAVGQSVISTSTTTFSRSAQSVRAGRPLAQTRGRDFCPYRGGIQLQRTREVQPR